MNALDKMLGKQSNTIEQPERPKASNPMEAMLLSMLAATGLTPDVVLKLQTDVASTITWFKDKLEHIEKQNDIVRDENCVIIEQNRAIIEQNQKILQLLQKEGEITK